MSLGEGGGAGVRLAKKDSVERETEKEREMCKREREEINREEKRSSRELAKRKMEDRKIITFGF